MRFFYGFMGLVLFVGGGGLWFYFNLMKRKRLLKNLLSLPKERRFFWYKLRKDGYEVKDINITKKVKICFNEEEEVSILKLDFLIRRNNKLYGGLFVPEIIEKKEMMKLFFVYCSVFKLKGLLFYNDVERSFVKTEG